MLIALVGQGRKRGRKNEAKSGGGEKENNIQENFYRKVAKKEKK